MWIVAVTESRSEAKAQANLHGHETYLPMVRELVVEGGKRMWRHGVLFPGYLFVKIHDQWRFLLSTIGIINVIRFGGDEHSPAVLSENVVATLKRNEKKGFIEIQPPMFRTGERVKIQSGYFAGMEGIYCAANSLERETVLLSLLGRLTPVSVSTGLLTPAC